MKKAFEESVKEFEIINKKDIINEVDEETNDKIKNTDVSAPPFSNNSQDSDVQTIDEQYCNSNSINGSEDEPENDDIDCICQTVSNLERTVVRSQVSADKVTVLTIESEIQKKITFDLCNDQSTTVSNLLNEINVKSSTQPKVSLVKNVPDINYIVDYTEMKETSQKEIINDLNVNDVKKKKQTTSEKQSAPQSGKQVILRYPEASGSGGVTLYMANIQCLTNTDHVNDALVEFYMKYILLELTSQEIREKTIALDALFYSRLKQYPNYSLGKRSKLNVFKRDFIIFPCNASDHWFLVIACLRNLLSEHVPSDPSSTSRSNEVKTRSPTLQSPTLYVFNSSEGLGENNLKETLLKFIRGECAKHNILLTDDRVEVVQVQVPQQRDDYNCAMFMLQYAEEFLKNPTQSLNRIPSLENWFDVDEMANKRQQILNIITNKSSVLGKQN